MLNRRLLNLGLAAMISIAASSSAMATAVAFVQVPLLLKDAPQVASVRSKLKKEFARRDNELVAQQKQIKKLAEKLQRDGSIMSQAEAKRLESDIRSRSRKLKNEQSEFQEDLTLRQNEELGKLRKVIAEIIIQVAKDSKIDIVLESGVVWASDGSNITSKVLDELKALNKKGK